MGSEGALILVGTPIGNLGDLRAAAVEMLRDADVIAAEDTRRTRGLLSHAGVRGGGVWSRCTRTTERGVGGRARAAHSGG